mgnify:CR=1 FL=1
MNTPLAIFGSSILGAASGVAVMFSAADMSTKQTQPKVESTPAPVVVKEEPVNVVTVKDSWAVKYTVIRGDYDCWTTKESGSGVTHERTCKINGVRTDLAGHSEHDTSITSCLESVDGGYSWQRRWTAYHSTNPSVKINTRDDWGCQAIYELEGIE